MTFGKPTAIKTTSVTGINNIDALLYGQQWKSNTVTFSFTESFAKDYESNYPKNYNKKFESLNPTQRAVARSWFAMYEDVSNLNMDEELGSNVGDATIRIAESNKPTNAEVADFPKNTVEAGDIWFNPDDYDKPAIGNFAFFQFGHEIGHALGLKHGHEGSLTMNYDRNSMEFSVMTYRDHIGDLDPIYNNESWGYAQSPMMYDIAAIQQMYGANFNTNSGNTIYTFSISTGEMSVDGVKQGKPGGNRIFRTIWDGNGIDTYDFSNYKTKLKIDLTPGGWSDLDVGGNSQRAKLDTKAVHKFTYARGHVFNALQYNGDSRSLIENAIGGSKNDHIIGNYADNKLEGGDGHDTLIGDAGNDTLNGGLGLDSLDGGDGIDTADYSFQDTYNLTLDLQQGTARITGNKSFETLKGIENLIGGTKNDIITGDKLNNKFEGGDGNDSLRDFQKIESSF